ncbi:MAG: hypothetical protein M3O90_03455 [Actinomycetota bacterium]|nr:hypothetical protein [Actinomycetota bacterium]
MTEVSKGSKIAAFKPPDGLEKATVDAFTGLAPGPFTNKTVAELFLPGTVPTAKETSRTAVAVDSASDLLWQDGCAGPRVTRGYFNLSDVEANFPAWQKANAAWGARAAKGAGVRGGPKSTRTSYFYNSGFTPSGRSWGAPFAPRALCPLYTPPVYCDPFALPTPTPTLPEPTCVPRPTDSGGGFFHTLIPTFHPKPSPKR